MSAKSGRKVDPFIEKHFIRLDQVNNQSRRYYWKCRYCGEIKNSPGARIEGRDNNLPDHLVGLRSCLGSAPASARTEANLFMQRKKQKR